MSKRIMRAFKLNEISAVTAPAQEHARVVIMKTAEPYWKRDFTQEQRDNAASSGAALPDGSFPIQNRKDLQNAIHAVGRASDPGEAKSHIIARAKALGAMDLLPEDWSAGKGATTMTEAEIQKRIDDAVKAATDALNKKLTEAEKKVAELPATIDAEVAKRLPEAMAKAGKEETITVGETTIRKSEVGEPTFNLMKAQQAQIIEAADKAEIAEFGKVADTTYKHLPGESVAKAKALRAVSKLAEDVRKTVDDMLKAAEAAMRTALTAVGKDGESLSEGPQADFDKGVDTMLEKNSGLTRAQAVDKFSQTVEGQRLYKAIQDAKAARH